MRRDFMQFLQPVLVLSAIVLLAAGALLLVSQPAECNAVGCTGNPNSAPAWTRCKAVPGQMCYECEYSYEGGYSKCWESASGDIQTCIDYQY